MPKVGRRHFAYSKSGRKAAAAYAKRSGTKVSSTKKRKKAK